MNDIEEIFTTDPFPRYPAGNVVISEEAINILAEQIAIAAMQVTDIDGRKISAMGKLRELPNLAVEVVADWLHCGVYIKYEHS